ncbi:MAG: Mth938-like domain-containing protein [Burkholderiales bacterium]
MKLHISRPQGRNAVTGYGAGYVMVNRVRYEQSLVVLPDQLLEDWNVSGFDALNETAVGELAALDVEIVLLGTGARLRFPHPRLLQPLYAAGTGVEVMDTAAACRTYNILVAEDRKVAAALLL